MRFLAIACVLLVLGACSQSPRAASTDDCARTATHDVNWSNPAAPDVITAHADGPRCAQAVVTFVIRNAQGDPLWAFASTYYDMVAGGVAPESAPAVSPSDIDRFLTGWADATEMHSGELPQWRADAATLTESADTFSYDTPFTREVYEMLRSRNLPMICYAAAVEATQCLIIDPASNAPTMMVAYGP